MAQEETPEIVALRLRLQIAEAERDRAQAEAQSKAVAAAAQASTQEELIYQQKRVPNQRRTAEAARRFEGFACLGRPPPAPHILLLVALRATICSSTRRAACRITDVKATTSGRPVSTSEEV